MMTPFSELLAVFYGKDSLGIVSISMLNVETKFIHAWLEATDDETRQEYYLNGHFALRIFVDY